MLKLQLEPLQGVSLYGNTALSKQSTSSQTPPPHQYHEAAAGFCANAS